MYDQEIVFVVVATLALDAINVQRDFTAIPIVNHVLVVQQEHRMVHVTETANVKEMWKETDVIDVSQGFLRFMKAALLVSVKSFNNI